MLVLSAAGAGCTSNGHLDNGGNDLLSAPLGTVSVYQLAGRLDMAVTGSSRTVATLSSAGNSVVIYGDPSGQAFVNGKPISRSGNFVSVGGILFVPEGLEGEIRPALRRPVIVAAAPPVEDHTPSSPAPVRRTRSEVGLIMLDPGHGGDDPGASSPTGMREKAVVLSTALTASELLQGRGANVDLTRRDDVFVELNERADMAGRGGARLFVSIHADSSRNRSADGFTVYVARSATGGSLALARAIERNLGSTGATSRGVRRADYRVLVRTSCPAVLVELGYLSNRAEAAKLSRQNYRDALANAICDGILEYLQGR